MLQISKNLIFSDFNEKRPKKAKKRPKRAILKIFFQFLKSVPKYASNDISYHNIWRKLIFRIFRSFFNEKRQKNAKKGQFWKCGFFSKSYITIRNIILGHFQSKLVIQIASKVQKAHFWTILGHVFRVLPKLPHFGHFCLFFLIFGHFSMKKGKKRPKKCNFENIFAIFAISSKIRIQRYIIP